MEKYLNNFPLWCEECVKIIDKLTGLPVPFRLNAAQRRVADILERQRQERKPMRIIILKARQWGSSTLTQAYMAWMQLVVRSGWHSLTVAHLKDAAAVIRGTYSLLLANYPEHMKDGDGWKLTPYEKTAGVSIVPARGCRLSIATSLSPDAVRGSSFFMAHLSEAAFWGEGDDEAAAALVRTVSGSVPLIPDSLVVIESTANGRNNFFYREWQRACRGDSDKQPVFVPWHEIEIYHKQLKPGEFTELLPTLDEYEHKLLDDGVPPSAVAWYHQKRKEYERHEDMMAEFPSYPHEAFASARKPTFTDDMLPVPTELTYTDRLTDHRVVLLPATQGRNHRLIICARRHDKIIILADYSRRENLSSLMNHVADLCHCHGASLLIINCKDDICHGRWCLRKAINLGINLCYATEQPLLDLDNETLMDAIDVHRQHLIDGRVAETNTKIKDEYIDFNPGKPSLSPGLLCRLAASLSYVDEIDASPIDISDFF